MFKKTLHFQLEQQTSEGLSSVKQFLDFTDSPSMERDMKLLILNFVEVIVKTGYDFETFREAIWNQLFEEPIEDIRDELDQAYREEAKDKLTEEIEEPSVDLFYKLLKSKEHYDSFVEEFKSNKKFSKRVFKLYLEHTITGE